jgi:peptidoglycan hydrolase-like protein with peptidoglycan-binding domain
MTRQLAFPPHQGLPFQSGPPIVDGYVEPDPGIQSDPRYSGHVQLEAGYVGSSRFTFADTSGAASSGAATVAFQGVRHNSADLIFLSWIIRFDFSFDEDDRIICVLRPAAATPGDERRIDIRPLTGPAGASATPADPGDYMPSPPDGLLVKSNKAPFHVELYRPAAGPTPWQQFTGVSNVDIKVRSEELDSGTSTTARYWSVELQVPTTKTGGGANWIDLQPSFGLYWNVVRVCSGAGCSGLTLNYDFCAQFPWPDPTSVIVDPPAGPLAPEGWQIPSSWFGEGLLSGTATGVDFRNGYQGIGIRTGGPGGPIGGTVDMTQGHTNTIAARVFDNDPSAGAVARGVTAEFRLADFGLGPYGNAALWDRIDIHGPGNPTPPHDIAAAGPDIDLTADWTITAADRTKYGPLWHDQCLWALLDSAAGASFAESSIRRNLALINLSKAKHPVTVTGKGHGAPARGAPRHDFLLHVVNVKYPEPRVIEGPGLVIETREGRRRDLNLEGTLTGEVAFDPGTVTWLHVVNGYRSTGRRLTIGKKRFVVWTHAGACSFLARHRLGEGESHDGAGYAWELGGGGIRKRGTGVYHVPVPMAADVRLDADLEAGPDVKPGDPTTPDRSPLFPKPPGTVREGSSGDAVRAVQFLLSVEGYGLGPGGIDGHFGPRTKTLVERFQRGHGLHVDGVVGPATWRAFFALAPLPSHPLPTITHEGARGPEVVFLQDTLNRAHRWFARGAPALAEDGHFGKATVARVEALERWASLKPDGVAGYRTWAVSSGPTLWDQAGPHAPPASPHTPPAVHEGQHGHAAQMAQFLLSAEGFGLAPAQIDGRFGAATKAAVERFQRAHDLRVDGVVGPRTWAKLLQSAPVPRHPYPPTLQHGAKGPVVELLQRTLNGAGRRFAAGQPPIRADGHYGPATVARVREFQAWGAVLVDGIVGPRTWSVAIGDSLWHLNA